MRDFAVQFVNQIKIKKWDYLECAGLILGCYVLGMIMFQVIMRIASDEGDEVFCMGSLMSVIMLTVFMLFIWGNARVTFFNYSIAMGRIRKNCWPALALESFLLYTVLALEIMLLQPVERRILELTWPGAVIEGVSGVLSWSLVLPLALMGTGFTLLCTAAMIKFGRAAYVAWYVLFVAVCILVPRLIERLDESDSVLYSRIADVMFAHFALFLLIAGLLVAVICGVVSWLMVCRQQVNI